MIVGYDISDDHVKWSELVAKDQNKNKRLI